MNTTRKNRVLSILLALVMVFSMVPVPAFAAGSDAANGYVAEVTINGTAQNYADIDEAFAAAQKADSATVKLLADVVEINKNKGEGIELRRGDTTLDLNGKTLKQAARAEWPGSGITVSVGSSSYSGTVGKLTICDSVGGGKIQQINTIPAVMAWGSGTLVIEGGTIEAPDSGEWMGTNQIQYQNCAVNIDDTATVIINGGTLKGVRGVVEDLSDGGGSLTITGGTFTGTSGNALIVYSGKATLSGGTFSKDSAKNEHSIWVMNGKAADLLAENYQYIAGDGTESKYSADGKGVVGDTVVKNPNDKSVNYINGKGELSTQADYTEIAAETSELPNGWYVVKGNVEVNGLNITNEVNLILCDGATLKVTEYLNIGKDSSLNLYWQSGGSGKLTAKAVSSDSTVTAPAGEMKKTADASGTTFEKCLTHELEYTVNSDGTHTATCKLCGKAEAAESHQYESWTAADEKTHTATCVCGAKSTVDHEFVYHLSADKKSHSGVCSVCNYTSAEELHDTNGENGSCSVCGADADVAEEKVEVTITQRGGTPTSKTYADLLEAFYDADTSRVESVEVRLLQSGKTYTLNSTKSFPIKFQYTHDVEVIVDLNGCTLKRSVTDNTYGILSVEEGNVTFKNGTLELDDSAAFNPASAIKIPGGDSPELTLANMTVKATRGHAIYTQGGTLNIESGAYGKVLINDNFATATLSGGSYDSVICYESYAKLLETGYIFAKQDGTYIDPGTMGENSETSTWENIENIKVIECPHKDGDTSLFENNTCTRCGFVCEHTGGTAGYFQKAKCAVCGNEYGALLPDTTAPTGSITVKERTPFQTFINKITFGLFFKADVTATVDATDDSYNYVGYETAKHAVKVEYLVSETAIDEAELKNQTYAPYDKAIDLSDEQSYVVYAKLTDHAGNVAYISSEDFVIDKTAPAIGGYTGTKTVDVCGESYTVTIVDNNLYTVVVDGQPKDPTDTIQFSYNHSGSNRHIVKATDRAGNESEITFVLHQQHEFDSATGKCKNCGESAAAKVQIGDTVNLYATFDEARNDYGDGTKPITLTLLKDVIPDGMGMALGMELTLDLNGHSFGQADFPFDLENGAKLTLTGAGRFEPTLWIHSGSSLTVEPGVTYVDAVKIKVDTFTETEPTDWSVALKGGTYGELDMRYTDRYGVQQIAAACGELVAPGYVFDRDDEVFSEPYAANVTVIPCTNHNWIDGVCDNCNLPCPHEHITGGECDTCGMAIVAQDDDGNYYSDLNAAFAGVQDDGKVTLLANVNSKSTLDANKTVTLNMAGYKLSVSDTSIALVVKSGYLTVTNSTGEYIDISGRNYSVSMTGGTLKFEKKVKLGGWLTVMSGYDPDTGEYTSFCKLEGGLKEGSIVTGGINVNGYDYSTGEGYENVLALLPEGCAFAAYQADGTAGSIVRADDLQLSGDLIVVAHEHGSFTYDDYYGGYYCACGYKHYEHVYDEHGHCTLCDYACSHEWLCVSETEDGKWQCEDCGAQMVVKVGERKYFSKSFDATGVENTLQTILSSGERFIDITLLADGLNAGVTVTKPIILNLNGKTLQTAAEPSFTVNMAGDDYYSLVIKGETASTLSYVVEKGRLSLNQKGGKVSYVRLNSANNENLTIGEYAPKIDRLVFGSAAVSLLLQHGEFGEIALADGVTGAVKVSSLRESNGGRAFQYTDNGSYVPRTIEITGTNSLKNVKLVVCPHEQLGENNCCLYCDTNYIVATFDNGIAIGPDAAENMTSHADEYLLPILARNGGSVKLLIDYVSSNGEFSYDGTVGKGTLDLFGHRVTVGTLTLPTGAELTVTDTSTGKTGEFMSVTVATGAKLTVNGVKLGTVTLAEGSTLTTTDGIFAALIAQDGKELSYFLPAGYAFADADTGEVVNGHASELHNVKVVEHTTHDFRNDTHTCGCGAPCDHSSGYENGLCKECGYACPHAHVRVDGDAYICSICHEEMVAELVADGAKSYYSTVAEAIKKANSAAGSAEIKVLKNESLPNGVHVTNASGITLDLNGHSVSNCALNVGDMDIRGKDIPGKLTVKDSSGGNGAIGLEVKGGGTLVFDPGNKFTALTQLTVWGGDVKLYGGRIQGKDKTFFQLNNGVKLADLLPEGYAFGLYLGNKTAPNAYISYDKAGKNDLSQWLSAYDLTPVACEHAGLPGDFSGTHCSHCNGEIVATLTNQDGKVNGYASLAAAIQAAKNGGTVNLLADVTVAEGLMISGNSAITLDLNGKTLRGSGDSATLTVFGNNVTVKNGTVEAEGGYAIQLMGTLTLADVTAKSARDLAVYVATGELTVNGGTYQGMSISERASSVTLNSGIFTLLNENWVSVSVLGGKYTNAAELLAAGHAFAKYDKTTAATGEIVNGYVEYLVEDVIIVEHTHDMTAGEDGSYSCACGFTCEHSEGFVDGKCTVCGYVCKHPADKVTVDENGVYTCGVCEERMAVKVENGDTTTYYAQSFEILKGKVTDTDNTLSVVFGAAPTESTVTLLMDDLSAWAHVQNGKTITLDLNGKKLIETANGICAYNDSEDNKLIVTGAGSSENTKDFDSSRAFAVYGGTLEFDDEFSGKFNEIYADGGTLTVEFGWEPVEIGTLKINSTNATIRLNRGTFDNIVSELIMPGSGMKLGDLLALRWDNENGWVHSGYAFKYTTGEQEFVPYSTEFDKNNPIKNVTIVDCHHESVTNRTCDYCGMEHVVAVIIDHGGSRAIYVAKDNSEEALKTAVGYALDGWNNIHGIGKAMKMYVDITLTADAPLNTAKDPRTGAKLATTRSLDLNGHKFTGGEYGLLVDELVTLTIKDTSAAKTGTFDNVTLHSGAALVVDGVKIGNLTLKAGSTLEIQNGGLLERVTAADGRLIDFLPDGYAFADADGNVKDACATTLTNVTLVEHEHGEYKWDAVTHEKVCACGHVQETDNTAPTFDGIETGKTYYNNSLTFTAEDTGSGIKKVKDGDTVLTPDKDGRYTITADNQAHTVTATDNAGNTATVIITVNKVYNVTLVSGTGYTVEGSSTVGHGQKYNFTVTVHDGYSRVENSYKVLVNGKDDEKLGIMGGETATDECGYYPVTGDLTITVEGVADITAPDAKIEIGKNTFRKLLNSLTFGLFFKDELTVTVTATDLGSRVAEEAEYLVLDGVFSKENAPTDGWTAFSLKDGEGSFSIQANAKGSVYVRVKDNAGNATIINSDGVVVYTDSEAVAGEISFTRLSDKDVSFEVKLNGNAVKSLSVGDTVIAPEQYTVSADGTITLKNDYLKTLAAGEYTVTVTYAPMGLDYTPAEGSGSEAPATTEVKLTVNRATRTTLAFSAPGAVYDGKAYDNLTITDKPDGTTVEYLVDGSYTTAAPKNAGSYTVRITTPQDENYNAATFTKDFTISPKEVTVTGVTAADKVYNGSTEATITGTATLSDNYDGENLTVQPGKASFADKNVGENKTVTFTGFALTGSAAGNYKLTALPASVTADITAKNLTVVDLKIKDKVYDGTNKAEFDGTPTPSGVEAGDDVQLNCGTPTFATTDVGENIAIRFTEFTLSGGDSGNYTLTQPTGIAGNIAVWIATGSEFTTTTQEWSNKPFTVTAKNGYLLSLTNTADGDWVTSLTGTETATGDAKSLTFYVKNVATGTISAANTRDYLYEITAPVGSIALNGSDSSQPSPLFFNSDVTVQISCGDGESGVKSVAYYQSAKALTSEEVQAITAWTNGRDFTVETKDMAQFVVYARVEDNAGNITYLSSNTAVFDTTAPEIVGIDNGKTYYVTQRVFVDDTNLASVTLNGSEMALDSYFELAGDIGATYTIAATDKAGNVTTYTVTMKPISDITKPIEDLTVDNVTSADAAAVNGVSQSILDIAAASEQEVIGDEQWNKLLSAAKNCKALTERISAVAEEIARLTEAVNAYDIDKVTSADKAALEQLAADIQTLLDGSNLTDAERAALSDLLSTVNGLLARIAKAKAAAESEEITAVKDITEDNVTTDDKDALEKAEKALEDAQEDFGGNYTDEESEELDKQVKTIREALEAIDNAEKAAQEIKKLPSVDDVTTADKDEVERVKQLLDDLTDNERSMVGKDALDRVTALEDKIRRLEEAAARTGDESQMALWLTLLCLSGSMAAGAAVLGSRKKQED